MLHIVTKVIQPVLAFIMAHPRLKWPITVFFLHFPGVKRRFNRARASAERALVDPNAMGRALEVADLSPRAREILADLEHTQR